MSSNRPSSTPPILPSQSSDLASLDGVPAPGLSVQISTESLVSNPSPLAFRRVDTELYQGQQHQLETLHEVFTKQQAELFQVKADLQQAITELKNVHLELSRAQDKNKESETTITTLRAQVEQLQLLNVKQNRELLTLHTKLRLAGPPQHHRTESAPGDSKESGNAAHKKEVRRSLPGAVSAASVQHNGNFSARSRSARSQSNPAVEPIIENNGVVSIRPGSSNTLTS